MKLLLKSPFIFMLIAATMCILFFGHCKDAPKHESPKYFYTDIAYYQLKNRDLFKCLIKSRGIDSCYCFDKYNEGGDPIPDDVTETDDVCQSRLGCCPCQNDIIFKISDNNQGPTTPPEGGGNARHCCDCLDILVIGRIDTFPPLFSYVNSKDRKPEDDLNRKVIKEEVTIKNKKYYQYSFPKDFNEDVQIKYRNTDLGSFTYRRGRVQSWCEHVHDDSHSH
jgi:hypothetical protein